LVLYNQPPQGAAISTVLVVGVLSFFGHRFLYLTMNNEDIKVDFQENTEGLLIQKTQDIPQEHLDYLKAYRADNSSGRMGEYHRAASIPTIIHEKWLSEGYDCTVEPIRKTLAKLRAEGLDYFITTDKAL